MNLKRGDKGPDVGNFVQRPLQSIGYDIKVDNDYGPVTERTVKSFQRLQGLAPTGVFDATTYAMLELRLKEKPEPPDATDADISVKAFQLILDYEVGGGESYYNKKLKHPTWPGGSSGVTIGVGFDLGYEGGLGPFERLLPTEAVWRLKRTVGLKGLVASKAVKEVADLVIPWGPALEVFENYTLAREIKKAHDAFPGLWKLPLDVQGALVSLVFNRGTSMSGDSRREMREIKEAVWVGDCEAIADALVRMKRLWGKDMSGLWRRRDAEARLVREAA